MERLIILFGYIFSGIALRYGAALLPVTKVWCIEYFRGRSPSLTGTSLLIGAGCIGLFKKGLSRYLAALGICILALLWFPSILAIAAAPPMLLYWRNLLAIALFFSVLWFVLMYPIPIRWWVVRILITMMAVPVLVALGATLSMATDYFRSESKLKITPPKLEDVITPLVTSSAAPPAAPSEPPAN